MVIPEGYKKTEIGIIPDDWDVVKICDSCDLIGGGTPSKSQSDWWKGTFPWISSSDLFFNSIHKIQITRYITKEAVINSATKKCPKYSVLVVTRVGVGKVACAPCDICTSQDFTNLIPHKHDPLYLSYYMAKEMKGKTDSIQGTSIKGITSKEISETIICLPDRNEQMRIATALNDIDSLIDNLEKLVEKKKNIKQGAMQELLTGKRRLPGFTGGWTVKTIGRSGYLYKETINPQLSPLVLFYEYSMPAFDNGKQPIMKYGKDMHSNRIVISGKVLLFNKLNVRQKRIWLIDAEKEKSVCSSEFLAYYSDEIDLLYLNYLLNSSKITKNFIDSSTGTSNSQQRITPDVFLGYSITVPSDIEEQTAIASILYDMDNEIEELEKKLAKYRCLKQGMMSELLTGHIRLTEKEDA